MPDTTVSLTSTVTCTQGTPGVTAWPVSLASAPLPTDAATATLQTAGNASLASIDGKVTTCNTGAVVVASSALPTGAATSALQGTTFDLDSGAGTQTVAGVSLRKAASGGSVELGTPSDPMRVDPTGSTTQPISAATLPLPSGAATEATLSSLNGKVTACNTGAVTVAASALPSGAATSALQGGGLPSALASDRLKVDGSGVTQPVSGAVALSAGSAVIGHVIADSGSTTAVTSLPSIPTGSNTIGAVTAPGAAALALDATLTGGTAKSIVRGGAKGGTTAADVTSTSIDADHNAMDVAVKTSALPSGAATSALQGAGLPAAFGGGGGVKIDGSGTALPVSDGGGSLTVDAPVGTPVFVRLSDGSAAVTPLVGAQLPAALGRAAAAASLAAVLSTEDAAKVPTLGQALAASSVPSVLPAAQDVVAYAGVSNRISTALASTVAGGVALGQALAASAVPVVLTALQDVAALATGAPDTTLPTNVMEIGGVAKATAPTAVTTGRSVRAWFSLAGAQFVSLLGVDGAAIAALANPVPSQLSDGSAAYTGTKTGQLPTALGATTSALSLSITSASDALFDVKDRAARLLGALTGINGSGVATGANPVPVQLSDGSAVFTGAKTGQLPPSLGVQVNTNVLAVVVAVASLDTQTTLVTAGKVIKSAPGICLGLTAYFNNTGVAVFFQVHDGTSAPSAGARPVYFSGSIANGTKSNISFGITAQGVGCPTGIVFVLSSTQDTFTAIASTAFPYSLQYH